MTDVVKAAILGVVEGLTEFLPVSSTGHMILAMPWLRIDAERPEWKAFLYFIQIGAILAVVVYFGRTLIREIFHRPAGGWSDHLLVKLAAATVPAAAVGLPLNDWVERHLETPVFVACALIVGAGAMEWIERRRHSRALSGVRDVTLRQSILIGVAQVVSIVPGTSRAMATIFGGLLVGLPRATATEFSFYLAIPTLLGAGMLKVVKHREHLRGSDAAMLAAGFAVAFIVALLVIDGFMRFVKRHGFRVFAVYRVILGLAVLGWAWSQRGTAG
ncbi:MAG: undecaprenyl-diphosphate phosphatase [Phycisphaerae bacterium]|nr:undecaprenyl-diphosphate phosphatase [Phycisphaerae bacterium]